MFLAVMIIFLLVVNKEVESSILVETRIRLRSKREVETKRRHESFRPSQYNKDCFFSPLNCILMNYVVIDGKKVPVTLRRRDSNVEVDQKNGSEK
uniref:Secreted protein n=1 Tax=Acrobeloides nanus TaxID=290746 RepID=A0A914E6T0_9BILA